MFDKLRTAFSNVAKNLGEKELNEDDIDGVLFDLEVSLLESDVASEVINSIKDDLKGRLVSSRVDKSEVSAFVRSGLIRLISGMFDDAGTVDVLEEIRAKKESPDPYIVLFVGINGTGKTTTVAKVAHLLKNSKLSVAVAASDTFRAGAIEQIKEHMNRLHLKIIAQNYGADPAAVARDAVLYARSHKIDCILIDTAGRMQTSKNLMEQIVKITNVVRPDLTVFVGDSLAGNDTVNQAREFHNHVKFNASILTKSDADARGGAALSIVKVTSTPVIFVGVGQEYGDLAPFDKDVFLKTVFGSLDGVDLEAALPERAPAGAGDAMGQAPGEEARQEPAAEPDAGNVPEPEAGSPEEPIAAETPVTKAEPEPMAEPPEEPTAPEAPDAPEEPDTEAEPEPEPMAEPTEEPTAEKPDTKDGLVGEIGGIPKAAEAEIREQAVAESPQVREEAEPKKQKAAESEDDPFEGISTADIVLYSDLYDVAPPEDDRRAALLADKVRRWISDNRPAPDGAPKPQNVDLKESSTEEPQKDDLKEPEKAKKKKGLFGRFR